MENNVYPAGFSTQGLGKKGRLPGIWIGFPSPSVNADIISDFQARGGQCEKGVLGLRLWGVCTGALPLQRAHPPQLTALVAQHSSTTGTGWSSARWLIGNSCLLLLTPPGLGDTGAKATYCSDLASQNVHLAYETAEENASPGGRPWRVSVWPGFAGQGWGRGRWGAVTSHYMAWPITPQGPRSYVGGCST